jgi:phosphoribosylamine---glycine ligase
MNLLVVGSGGREHALAWALSRSSGVREVFAAPGNPGMALEPKVTCTGVSAADFAGILRLCQEKRIGFVVVGPDQALADGLVDFLEEGGVKAFGPSRAAAQIEASKAFSKELMREKGIPTARFEVFTDVQKARDFLTEVDWGDGWVIKADGLALGKGVVVCAERAEALNTVSGFLEGGAMGEAGRRIVVEERLLGREVSAFSLCDGASAVSLGFACDYKRIGDGDRGPNTGGMGAFSPADWLPTGMAEKVQAEVVLPLLSALRERGAPFKGVLFTGLMMTPSGPKVLEFNARFGDPETQALLPLLDEDLLPWLQAARDGRLAEMPAEGPRKKNLHSVHVVLAAAGYPGTPRRDDPIQVPPELFPADEVSEDRLAKLFFAGLRREGSPPRFVTAGGRVLGLTALAVSREEARTKAYALLEAVSFDGAQRRGDVGK